MNDVVITVTNQPDTIIIEDEYSYEVLLTLGLAEGGDFYLRIEFQKLSQASFLKIIQLGNEPRSLKFYSFFSAKEEFNITHIVVTKYSTDSKMNMVWECLSDDPALYSSLILD